MTSDLLFFDAQISTIKTARHFPAGTIGITMHCDIQISLRCINDD
jgi:hypothetical protein